MCTFFLADNEDYSIKYPLSWVFQALATNIGKGKGLIKSDRVTLEHIDVYYLWSNHTDKFSAILHITKDEFDIILLGITEITETIQCQTSLAMPIANKVLMALHFVVQYTGGNNLATLFNCSDYYVSKVLDEMFPPMVEYFSQFIPNKKIYETRSSLHASIKYIIDGTLHKTQRQNGEQDDNYNGHYRMHGKLTQILLDFEGYVVAFKTNIKGRTHDALAAIYSDNFKKIVGKHLVLGDPGYHGVGYVVPGFKPSTVKTMEQVIFDKISRSEQVAIENANNFIKENKSVNKQDTFRHNEKRLVACVFISIGMYNLKRSWGYFKNPFSLLTGDADV